MVVMHHEIGVSFPGGSRQTRTCTLVGYGKEDMTIMASTVGLTAAAGASLILAGRLEATGVVRPTIPQVYLPTLELLASEVVVFCQCALVAVVSVPACYPARAHGSVLSAHGAMCSKREAKEGLIKKGTVQARAATRRGRAPRRGRVLRGRDRF